jgi:hypothetical protein
VLVVSTQSTREASSILHQLSTAALVSSVEHVDPLYVEGERPKQWKSHHPGEVVGCVGTGINHDQPRSLDDLRSGRIQRAKAVLEVSDFFRRWPGDPHNHSTGCCER